MSKLNWLECRVAQLSRLDEKRLCWMGVILMEDEMEGSAPAWTVFSHLETWDKKQFSVENKAC